MDKSQTNKRKTEFINLCSANRLRSCSVMHSSKGCLQPGAYIAPSERIIDLWRSDKIKKKGFRLLDVASCGKVSMWGEVMEDKGCFSKICYVHYISGLRVSGD